MAHAQKPDFVFPRNGRVHLNRWGRQFSRLLAAEVCASAWVLLDRPRSEVAWEYWLPTPFASFPVTFPPVRHRVSSHFNWALPVHPASHPRRIFFSTPVRKPQISNTTKYVTVKETRPPFSCQRACQQYKELFWKVETYMTVYFMHTDMLRQTKVPDREQWQWLTAYKKIL